MSVDRNLTIRVVSNFDKFSDLFESFVFNFWRNRNNFSASSLDKDDIDNFDFIDYINFDSLKNILDEREANNIDNFISLWIEEYDENILISSKKRLDRYSNYSSHYELNFSLGYGKRIANAERYTDYGFYLNRIIPRLIQIGCYVCEVKCQDFDS